MTGKTIPAVLEGARDAGWPDDTGVRMVYPACYPDIPLIRVSGPAAATSQVLETVARVFGACVARDVSRHKILRTRMHGPAVARKLTGLGS